MLLYFYIYIIIFLLSGEVLRPKSFLLLLLLLKL